MTRAGPGQDPLHRTSKVPYPHTDTTLSQKWNSNSEPSLPIFTRRAKNGKIKEKTLDKNNPDFSNFSK